MRLCLQGCLICVQHNAICSLSIWTSVLDLIINSKRKKVKSKLFYFYSSPLILTVVVVLCFRM